MANDLQTGHLSIFINQEAMTLQLQALEENAMKLREKIKGVGEDTLEWAKKSEQLKGVETKIADLTNLVSGKYSPSVNDASKATNALIKEIANFRGTEEQLKPLAEKLALMKDHLHEMQVKAGLAKDKVEELGLAGKGAEYLKEQFMELVGPLAAAAGAAELLKKGFEEFNDTQLAVAMLRNTLQNIHQENYMGELAEMTEKLREQFNYLSEKDIAKTQDKLITFGHLSKNQIAELMPVIVNLAAKLGTDLPSAADKLLGAIEKPLKEFKELGIDIKQGKTEAERFGIVMEQIAPRVAGAAQTFADSNKGWIESFKTNFNETLVSMGRWVAQTEEKSIALANASKAEGEEANNLIATYEALNKKTNLTTEEKVKLHDAENGLISIFGDSITEIDKETGAIKINLEATKKLAEQKMFLANDKLVEEATKYEGALEKNTTATKLWNDEMSRHQDIQKQIDDLKTKAESGLNESEAKNLQGLIDKQQKLNVTIQQNKQEMVESQEVMERQKKVIEELGSTVEKTNEIMNGSTPKGDRDTPFRAAQVADDGKAQKELDKLKAQFEKFEDEVAKIGGTADENQRAKLQEHYSKLLDEAQEFTKKHLQSDEKYMQEYDRIMGQWKSDLAALDKKEADEKLKKEEEAAKKEIELKKKLAEQFSSTTKAEYQQAKNDFGDYINSKRSGLEEDYANGRINKKEFDNSIRQLDIEAKKGELLIAQDYAKNDVQAQKDAVALKAGLIHSEVVEVQKTEQEKARIRKEITRDSFNALKELSAAFFSSQDSKLNVETKKWDAAENRKKTALDARLKAGKISQANYDEEIAKIDAETTARKNKDAHDQAVMKKKQAEFNAGLQLAEAIGSIWAEYPKFDGGIAMAVALGAAGVSFAAQIANIASMEIPPVNGYARGTEFIEGQGTGTSDSILARVSRGERIVDAATNAELGGISNKDLPKLKQASFSMSNMSVPQVNWGAVSNSMVANRGNSSAIGSETFFSNMSAGMYKQGNEQASVLNSILLELKKDKPAVMSLQQWHEMNTKYLTYLTRGGL